MSEILMAIDHDNPDMFYLDGNNCTIMATLFSKTLNIAYKYSMRDIKALQQQISTFVSDFKRTETNSHQSEYDLVLRVHDYLKTSIVYDYAAAETMDERRSPQSFNIIGALINHKCVCSGFAKAMMYICRELNVECLIVTGIGQDIVRGASGPHAWNIVKINGYYHHVDVTWDCQQSESKIPNYTYLNLSDSEIEKDHIWKREGYPICDDQPYNYFRVNGALVDSRSQLINYLRDHIEFEEEYILFKVQQGSRLSSELPEKLQEYAMEAASKCRTVKASYLECYYTIDKTVFTVYYDYK